MNVAQTLSYFTEDVTYFTKNVIHFTEDVTYFTKNVIYFTTRTHMVPTCVAQSGHQWMPLGNMDSSQLSKHEL